MRNKFNYSERETQTPPVVIRERGVSTVKPPLVNYTMSVNQSYIYDLYVKDKHEKEKKETNSAIKDMGKDGQSLYSPSFKRCLKIMERMIVQNEQQQYYKDYKYMFSEKEVEEGQTKDGQAATKEAVKESVRDTTKDSKKKHAPLWNFSFVNTNKKNVTSICWNPKYSDMFVVGYGLYQFGKKKSVGYICICSLKNNKTSEMVLQTDGDVMSLDFHPLHPALLAVGLYDGVVLVYDVRNKNKQPIYQSSIKTKKHTDPVWQVKWNPVPSENNNFYSISSDGRVMNWILMKDKLEPEEVIRLKLVNNPVKSKLKNKQNDEETSLISLACGLCFDFNTFDNFAFIVGTEEGNIHKCSKAYSGQYQKTYEGHQLAVYKVRWNPFHERTFISASADWTIKIWDCDIESPVMSFEIGQVMVDVVWSPFCSAVFIALSVQKAYVYNLELDRHAKDIDIKPTSFETLTNVAFNPKDPVFLVGDCKGQVGVFKLSQRLAKPPADPKDSTFLESQKLIMEKLLHLGNFDRDDETVTI